MKIYPFWKNIVCAALVSATAHAATPYTLGLDPTTRYWRYTAKKSDNLWSLAVKYSQTRYVDGIQQLNEIKDPYRIPPGTVIKIPLAWLNLKNVTAKVVSVVGQPMLLTVNNQSLPVQVGMRIDNGSQLITATAENVLLEFDDKSRLLLKQNSQIMFENLQAYDKTGIADSRVLLRKGSSDNFVNPSLTDVGTHYQIRTPSSIMAVRGTAYRVNAGDDQSSRSEVLKGKVLAQGVTAAQLLPEKTGTTVQPGQAPLPPKKLLPAPHLATIPSTIKTSVLNVPFKALPGAVGYRIEIAPDKSFSSLVYEGRTDQPILQSVLLPGGTYAARVRGIDKEGLEGMDAVVEFSLIIQLPPPFIMLPRQNEIVYEQNTTFKWAQVLKASRYHFQLSRSANFSSLLIDRRDLIPFEFRLADQLVTGDYYWRVASVDTNGQEGEFSDVQKFTHQPNAEMLTAETAQIQARDLMVRWKKTSGQIYRVQLANDDAFTDIVTDLNFSHPFIALPPGTYYIRVGLTEKKNGMTAFGAVQKIEIPADYWQTLFLLSPLLFLL
jgi:hypothetical protein